MPKRYVRICNLWGKDTARGYIISAQANGETLDALRIAVAELASAPGKSELVIFPNDKRKHERSPTHSLVLALEDDTPSHEPAHASAPPAPARSRQSESPARPLAGAAVDDIPF